jgi:hypothetical protein
MAYPINSHIDMVYHILMPRSAQANFDPEFWDRLRDTLISHMRAYGLNQRELAPKLGIDPTTLNNFLNRQNKTLGGLAVALACTLVNLDCNGTKIGRIEPGGNAGPVAELLLEQLVLEFDDAFEVKSESEQPTIVLRKSTARQDSLRLAVRRIG